MGNKYDAIVVGGGVIGAAVAYYLSKERKRVLLVEQNRLATKASSAAAGMLAAHSELKHNDPIFPLAKESRQMFSSLAKEIKECSGIDIELIEKGMLKVALSDEEKVEFKRQVLIQQQNGEQIHWLDKRETIAKEPNLSTDIKGAIFIEKDNQVSAPALAYGLAKSAAYLGAEIKEHCSVYSFHVTDNTVTGVQTSEGDYYSDYVIAAGGPWTQQLLMGTGLEMKTSPVKGECFSVITHQPLLSSTVFTSGCYIVPKKGGRTIVGATVKPNTFSESVSYAGVEQLMDKARKLIPCIINAEWEKAWAGIRPKTNDGLPYIGTHPTIQNLLVATGHYRNGILLSPITGVIITDLITGRIPKVDVQGVSPSRTMVETH
ncbi:glycine oxidase ThiO [Salirhabdus salicampi]|uniref:glycine oxidase ThiO n=1 Tax=Salirhabdus salicampi TaxID=476102 RepID=UPI0020C41A89|nr:glycine oxidase ThiO [Salirhabdus salicampi]